MPPAVLLSAPAEDKAVVLLLEWRSVATSQAAVLSIIINCTELSSFKETTSESFSYLKSYIFNILSNMFPSKGGGKKRNTIFSAK